MLAFEKCKKYEDFIEIIKQYLISGEIYNDDNERGFSYLVSATDSKKDKLIKVMHMIDKDLSYSRTKNNEMWKKINQLLSLGIFSKEYSYYFDKLDFTSIFTLISGGLQTINEYNEKYIPLLCDERLLQAIEEASKENDENFPLGKSDYFFMIEQHYDEEKFDITNKALIEVFINKMIDKINKKTIHIGVMNMIEYWESDEMMKIRSEVSSNSEDDKNETRRF